MITSNQPVHHGLVVDLLLTVSFRRSRQRQVTVGARAGGGTGGQL